MDILTEDYILNILDKQSDISNALLIRTDWFSKPINKIIFNTMIKEKTNSIKTIGVKHKLDNKYINYLTEEIYISQSEFNKLKKELETDYKKRTLKHEMNIMIKEDHSLEEYSIKLIELSQIMNISNNINNSMSDIIPIYKDSIFNKSMEDPLLKTNYIGLDKVLSLLPQNVTIIGAGTGLGKTTLAINIFREFIINDYAGAYYSLEMSKQEMMNKLTASMTGISHSKLFKNNYILNDEEQHNINEALKLIDSNDNYIEDSFNMSIDDIKQDLRSKKLKSDIKYAFIDHIGLVGATEFKSDRRLSISHMSRELKKISKELDIHIIIVVQLNRQAESTSAGLEHLAESHDLSRDASNILLIDKDRISDTNIFEVKIAKARQGRNATLHFELEPEISKVSEYE